jgi:hypothetical protein
MDHKILAVFENFKIQWLLYVPLRLTLIETGNVLYSNTEALSLNYCFRGKAINIIISECACGLRYPARNMNAPYYIVIYSLFSSTIFFRIVS